MLFLFAAGCSLQTPYFEASLLSRWNESAAERLENEPQLPTTLDESPPASFATSVQQVHETKSPAPSGAGLAEDTLASRQADPLGSPSPDIAGESEPASEETHSPAEEPQPRFSERRLADARKVLTEDLWCENLELDRWKAGQIETPISKWRWYHGGIEEWMRLGDGERPEANRFLGAEEMVLACNASIVLARQGDASGREVLLEGVQSPSLSLKMRNATVEALGLLQETAVEDLSEFFKKFNSHPDRDTPDRRAVPSLEEEILLALAEHQKPYENEVFKLALGSRSPEIRWMATRIWQQHPPEAEEDGTGGKPTLPEEIVRGHADADARIRAAVMKTLGAWRPPEALRYFKIGLRDRMMEVKEAAILGLGEYGGKEAIETLRRLCDDSNAAVRAATVRALTEVGEYDLVYRMSDDQDADVRAMVARALRYRVDRKTENLFRELVEDSSPQVQIEAVRAVAHWPVVRGGPLLLEAMAMPTLMTRKVAAERLARQWPGAERFPYDAFASQREEELEAIKDAFHREVLSGNLPLPGGQKSDMPESAVAVTPERLSEVKQWIRRMVDPANPESRREDARLLLARMEQEELMATLRRASEQGYPIPGEVFSEVLCEKDSLFVSIEELASDELRTRRQAARRLGEATDREAFHPIAVDRIYQHCIDETDELTLASVLEALEGHPYESVAQLAGMASGHPSPSVRKRASRLLVMFSDDTSTDRLIALLEDPSVSVIEEAIRSLGRRGRLDDREPLKRMLLHSQNSIVVEAATALCRLGDPSGFETMRHFVHSENDMLKLKAIRAIGDVGKPEQVPLLMTMLEENGSIRSASLESLEKIVGKDFHRGHNGLPLGTQEQVEHWKKWYREKYDAPTT